MKRRYVDVVRLLLAWAPLTAEDIFTASTSFARPFATVKRCQEELRDMHAARLVARRPVPDTGRGQKPFAYFLRRGAAALAAEVADVPKSNSVFDGFGKNPWHALAIGELGCLVEAHAARNDRVEVLERIRDRQFSAEVTDHTRLIPDGTLLVEINGRRKLLFIEMVNQTSVINPGAHNTRARSLAWKLAKYRAFNGVRREHPTWRLLEQVYGSVGGFQVLVVSTRKNSIYLSTAAEGSNTMFLFADLDALRASEDIFGEPVWWLPRSPWRTRGPSRTALVAH